VTATVGILTERMILGFGVDLVVHETARRLAARGFAPTVFTTRVDDTFQAAPYPIVDLTATAGEHDVFSRAFMVETLPRLASRGVDAWLVETPPFYHWLPHLPGPVVCVEHGTPPGSFFPRRLGRRIDALTVSRYREVYGRLRPGDGVVAISQYIRSCLPPAVRERAVVIHNGADHYPLATAEEAAAFRRQLGIGEDQVMVLWVGRAELANDLQPYKGFRELLTLAPRLVAAVPQVRVVVVGRGDDAARQAMVRAGITVAFSLPRPTMPAALRAADLLLSTSRWEGFNLPLAEAQFQGTPVVAYRLCAHPEVVADGVSGVLVERREELLEAAVHLARDKERRQALSAGARAVAARFSWDANADALAAYLRRCLEERQDSAAAPAPLPAKDLRYYGNVVVQILRQEGPLALAWAVASGMRKRLRRLLSSGQ